MSRQSSRPFSHQSGQDQPCPSCAPHFSAPHGEPAAPHPHRPGRDDAPPSVRPKAHTPPQFGQRDNPPIHSQRSHDLHPLINYTPRDTPDSYGKALDLLSSLCAIQGEQLMTVFTTGLSLWASAFLQHTGCTSLEEGVSALDKFQELFPSLPISPLGAKPKPAPPRPRNNRRRKFPPCTNCKRTNHSSEDCFYLYYCLHCKSRGHPLQRCRWAAKNAICPRCDICDRRGHTADTCRLAPRVKSPSPSRERHTTD